MPETKIEITNPIAQILIALAVVLFAVFVWPFLVAAIILIVVVGLAGLIYFLILDWWSTIRPWWKRRKLGRKR